MKVLLTILIVLTIAGKVYASPAIVFVNSNQTISANTSPTDTTNDKGEMPDPDKFIQTDISPDANDVVKQMSHYIVYPEEALRNNLEGTVTLQILLNEEGKVLRVKILSSTNDVFKAPAEASAYKVKTIPAVSKGKPIKYWMTIPVRFTFKDNDKISLLGYNVTNENLFTRFLGFELSRALMKKYPIEGKKIVLGIVRVSLTLETDGDIDDVVVLSTSSEYLGKVIPDMLEDLEVRSGVYPKNEDVKINEVILNVKLPEED